MPNVTMSTWPSGSDNVGWPNEPRSLMPGRPQGWPRGTQATRIAGERLLSQAVGWWDAAYYTAGDRFLRNRGVAGDLLDMRLGSALAANTNDPLWLGPEAVGYAYVPDVAANFLSILHVAGTQVGDTMDWRVDVSADNWNPAAARYFMGKATGTTAANVSFSSNASTSNRIFVNVSDGTTLLQISFAVLNAAPFTTASRLRLRFTYTRNTGAGQYAIGLYYNDSDFGTALDALSSWTQLGVTATGASIGATNDAASDVRVAAQRSASDIPFAGRYYGAALIVGGNTVMLANCDVLTDPAQTTFAEQSSNAATVTINRATSGRKTVAMPARGRGGRALFLLGTDDYLEVQDGWQHQLLNFGQGDSFTVLAVVRQWANGNNNSSIVNKANASVTGGPGWVIYATSNSPVRWAAIVGDDNVSTSVQNTSVSLGTQSVIAMTVDRAAQRLTQITNNVQIGTASTSSITAITTQLPMRVGTRSQSTTVFVDMEFTSAAVFRRALTAAEITLLNTYFQNRNL